MRNDADARQASSASPPTAVIGSHRVFGRTPLDALSNFCDGHGWHAQSVPPPNVDALTSAIYPIGRPEDHYPVRVTRLEQGEGLAARARGEDRFAAHRSDYRVIVLPR